MEDERTRVMRRGPPPPPPWYREHWWIWLIVLLLIVGGIIAFFALRGSGGDDQQTTQQPVTVPDVVGLEERAARDQLEAAGFQVEVVREASDRPSGVVADQDPGGGSRLAPGARVRITVSTGPAQTVTQTQTQTVTTEPETVAMPDVVGAEYPDAVEQLVDARLFPNSFPVESTEERGNVVDQRPDAGAKVPPGSPVRIDVSLGPGEREDREVPDLTGENVADALGACADAGFTCQTTAGAQQHRHVVGQQPAAGGTAPELTQITLVTG
jgi:serine/threonine-protein kinase